MEGESERGFRLLTRLMRCKKCEKLIHRMVDGDLTEKEKKDVCAHIETCSHCASYYNDITSMCSALHEPDQEAPEEFRTQWKQAVAQAAATGQKKSTTRRQPHFGRLGYIIPAVACGAVAVFVLSSSLGSPQGAAIRQITSGQGAVSTNISSTGAMPNLEVDGQIKFEEITQPQVTEASQAETVPSATGVPSTTKATASKTVQDETSITANGSVEELPGAPEAAPTRAVASFAEQHFGDGPVDLAPATPYEVPVSDQAIAQEIYDLAVESETISILVDEDVPWEYVLEGPADTIREILDSKGYSIPEGTTTVSITWEAEAQEGE